MLLETFAPNLVFLTAPVSRYWAKLRRGYFRFPDFWSTLIKENCHNSRTSDDIDMKLGTVTKLDKRNKKTAKKFDDDLLSENCDVIISFLIIYSQFGAMRKPDSGRIVCKTYVFINSDFLSYKNWKHYCFT